MSADSPDPFLRRAREGCYYCTGKTFVTSEPQEPCRHEQCHQDTATLLRQQDAETRARTLEEVRTRLYEARGYGTESAIAFEQFIECDLDPMLVALKAS